MPDKDDTSREPIHPARRPGRLDGFVADARRVLDANWNGSSTVPSRSLYPHQWSWDSAFISIGRSWYDEERARTELLTLFDAQWGSGKLPHIVFNPAVADGAYFPGPDFWSSRRSPDAPRQVATSGLTQPPIHARAALEMHVHAADPDASRAFLRRIYPRLAAQHDYLGRRRDPARLGLPAIVHPWESGLDNSPAWDHVLADLRIPPGAVPPYRRSDVTHADPDDRPTDKAYDAFAYLVALYRDSGYADDDLLAVTPFVIAGPLFAAIHLWSTHALAEIARIIGADHRRHEAAAEAIHAALIDHLWDPAAQRFYARNLVSGRLEQEETIVSFAPLLDPDLPRPLVDAICADLESACYHPGDTRHYVVPTYSVRSPAFDRRRYWRGPVWLNTNWLIWSGLRQHGRADLAAEVVASSLELASRVGFFEYFDPFDVTGHGSADFSWSAALALDLAMRQSLDEVAVFVS